MSVRFGNNDTSLRDPNKAVISNFSGHSISFFLFQISSSKIKKGKNEKKKNKEMRIKKIHRARSEEGYENRK